VPEWRCRLAVPPIAPRRCEGPRHSTCGLRYQPGEYTLTRRGLALPGIGTVRIIEGAGLPPAGAAAIVYRDGGGWTVRFEMPAAARPPGLPERKKRERP
jgi:hypothetical protein